MEKKMTTAELNLRLLTLQNAWLERLDGFYRKQGDSVHFSEPFAFGLSDAAMQGDRPRLMYIGEEARNWLGFAEHTQKYRQQWAVTYLEHQLYGEAKSEDCTRFTQTLSAADRQALRKNSSPYWRLLKETTGQHYAPCWNNLDKLHRVVKGKTRPLTYGMEAQLHAVSPCEQGGSLLLEEIRLTRPQVLLFMGGAYGRSMEWALGLPKGSLEPYRPTEQNAFVNEISEMPLPLRPCGVKRMLWIAHPAYISRKGGMQAAVARIRLLLCE